MTVTPSDFSQSYIDALPATLPFLRRYARVLSGSQSRGDALAERTLRAIVDQSETLEAASSARVALFQLFHRSVESDSYLDEGKSLDPRVKAARRHLARLTPMSREVLILKSLENFTDDEVSEIVGMDQSEVTDLAATANREMIASMSGDVLVIEDEALIALDLTASVSRLGHNVLGVARTHQQAIEIGRKTQPDLILSDIQLADNSSGIDAVRDLLSHFGEIPVIFITAFPEDLLTGEGPEPAFLIAKPYTMEQVESAVVQAMFFSSAAFIQDSN